METNLCGPSNFYIILNLNRRLSAMEGWQSATWRFCYGECLVIRSREFRVLNGYNLDRMLIWTRAGCSMEDRASATGRMYSNNGPGVYRGPLAEGVFFFFSRFSKDGRHLKFYDTSYLKF